MAEATQSELEAVAALVGTTNAELKHLDGQLTEESASLQSVNKNWNPNKILKDHITVAGGGVPSPNMDPSPVSNQLIQPQTAPPPGPAPPPPYVHPPQPVAQPVQAPGAELQIILQEIVKIGNRLEVIERKVTSLESLDTKLNASVEKGLKSKVKQITIKLDDTGSSK